MISSLCYFVQHTMIYPLLRALKMVLNMAGPFIYIGLTSHPLEYMCSTKATRMLYLAHLA